MENNKLIYTVIKTAVENGIRYIEDNPKRGVRNLLDLGEFFSSGNFQKDFFKLSHEILSNENSFYYNIIDSLVKEISHKKLTVFGINIGYNSFTYGTRTIRENEKKLGYNIPWAIVFNFENDDHIELTEEELLKIINAGKKVGIYSYFILLKKNMPLKALSNILLENDDCAFTLFVEPDALNYEVIEKLSLHSNLCIFVSINYDYDKKNKTTAEKFNILKKHRCLCGLSYSYDDKNADYILSGKSAETMMSLKTSFAMYIKKRSCSIKTAQEIRNFINSLRIKDSYPVFMMDLYGDLERINEIISAKSCFLGINNRGQISISDSLNETSLNIRNKSLNEILASTMPKAKYT